MFLFQANSKFIGIVIAERTLLSEQYFSGLQKFVVLELGLTLLAVRSPAEAAQLIAQMVTHLAFYFHCTNLNTADTFRVFTLPSNFVDVLNINVRYINNLKNPLSTESTEKNQIFFENIRVAG